MRSYLVPFGITCAVTTMYILWSEQICLFLSAKQIKVELIFSGLFNISAILTGFLMTIYCFIAVSSNPFISKVHNTSVYQEIKRFMLATTVITFISTICSLALSALSLELTEPSFGLTFAISLWVFFTTLGIAFFFSCLHFFLILSDDVPKKPIKGG